MGSWSVARATIGQVFSRFRDTKRVSASISASERVAVLAPEGAPKGSGKPSMAMVETQGCKPEGGEEISVGRDRSPSSLVL